MNTFKCIFCLKEFSEEQKSVEHVFPEAIGGSFLINELCHDCNKSLGGGADAVLVNHYFISAKRMLHQIKGKRGEIPNILEKGVLVNDPSQKVKYTIKDGKPEKLYLYPNVKRTKTEKGERVDFKLDISEKAEIKKIVQKMVSRRGTSEKIPIPEIEYMTEVREEYPEVQISANIDTIKYLQGIFKIAYELGFYFLGPEYLGDPIAEKMRAAIFEKAFDLQYVNSLNLRISDKIGPPISALRFHPAFHYANINRIEDIGITLQIRIFDVFEFLIVLSENIDFLPQGTMKFLIADSVGRTTEIHDMAGFLNHLSEVNSAS